MATGWGRQSWGVDLPAGPCNGGGLDSSPPIVTNVVPATGVSRGSTQSVQFDVIDDIGLRAVILFANFNNGGPCEVIWDGLQFRDPYSASVQGVLIVNRSQRFVVSRRGGWPASTLEVVVNAIDTSGNEA